MGVLGLNESRGRDASNPNSPVRLYCGDENEPGQQVVLF